MKREASIRLYLFLGNKKEMDYNIQEFCYISFLMYICNELFDEMQSAAIQHSYIIAKSLPTTFFLTTQRCHSDRYSKVSYPGQR